MARVGECLLGLWGPVMLRAVRAVLEILGLRIQYFNNDF